MIKNKWKEVMIMMAMLMAINIVAGRYTLKRVPKYFYDDVVEHLKVMGYKFEEEEEVDD